jgi:PAS domain-containing protein
MDLSLDIALALLAELPEGIAVVDARHDALPVVFVNRALAALRGCAAEQLVGLPLAGLLEDARESGRVGELKALLARGEGVSWRVPARTAVAGAGGVTEVRFQPVRAAGGEVTHYLSVHRPVAAPAVAPAVAPAGAPAAEPEPQPAEADQAPPPA